MVPDENGGQHGRGLSVVVTAVGHPLGEAPSSRARRGEGGRGRPPPRVLHDFSFARRGDGARLRRRDPPVRLLALTLRPLPLPIPASATREGLRLGGGRDPTNEEGIGGLCGRVGIVVGI
jgi:hypothetical protein